MNDYTKTPNYSLYKPTPNADDDVWGDHLNANADTLDGLLKRFDQRGSGGGVLLVTDYLPLGQPDGITDVAPYLQDAIDAAAAADPANRAAAPGFARLMIQASLAPYIIGASLYIPSNSHIIIAQGATLKLAPQTNAHMFLLCCFAHHVLIELYGTLDGNSSQQYFAPNEPVAGPPPTDTPPTSISGGISNDTIWGGPARNPTVQGGICSHVRIVGDRNGLITNFQNGTIGLNGATNAEIFGISMTNSAFRAGSVGVSGWRNFPYDPAVGTPLTFTGTYVAATNIVTLATSVPHCMVPGEEFITEFVTGTSGTYNCATGKLFITLPGTTGNTIVYNGTGGGSDAVITGGRITNWFYQQATIAAGTYVPATGIITVTTTVPHQLVYGQMISSNIIGGMAAVIATGIFQLLDVTDGQDEPPIPAAKNVTLRYRAARSGTTVNIVSGSYDAPSGIVTLTTDAPHGLSPGDVVTVGVKGSGFLAAMNAEQLCIAGTTGTAIKYQGPPNITNAPIVISGGTVTGGPTQTITGGTIGVSTKVWNSGFDNCFMDQIRDVGPCIYGGGVNCYIRHCEVTRNIGSGPYLFSDQNSGRCVDCEISGNYIHDNYGAGFGTVNFGPSSPPHIGTRIFDNYVTGNRGGAGFGSVDGLDCYNNRFYANRIATLNTYGSTGEVVVGPHASRVKIYGNTLRDPCVLSSIVLASAVQQIASGTYDNTTGAVVLNMVTPLFANDALFTNAYFTLSGTTGTGAHTSIEGRYIVEQAPANVIKFHAPAGLGASTISGGQVTPTGFGICVHSPDRCLIADNFIGDYQNPPTMLAAIGGQWGPNGVCTGNYYGPRINGGGGLNFPADMSAGALNGNNFDTVTGFTDGTTLRQPFGNDVAEGLAPLGITVGYNRSGGRGESNIYVGAANASPGGFDFIKVIGLSVGSPPGTYTSITATLAGSGNTYDSTTGNVVLTTTAPHTITVGTVLSVGLSSVVSTDSHNSLNGIWTMTAATGTTLTFTGPIGLVGIDGSGNTVPVTITGGNIGVATVSLTTKTVHGLSVGSRFTLSLVLGTDSIGGGTNLRDIGKLNGNWIATADGAGTSGTALSFVLTQNVAGVPLPYTGLDITAVNSGAINASELDSGVIDTSVGLPVNVNNAGTNTSTTGGSLLSVDGYANTRLSGALVHGAIQAQTLVNAGTVTVPQNTSFVLVQNASSIATGSLVLPAPAPSSFQTIGSVLDVRFQNPVGALTVTAATGAAVAGPPTTVLSAGAAFRFIQGGPGAAANTWLPCIPDVSGTPPVGGPYLPVSGGAVTGALTVNGMSTHTAGLTVSGGGSVGGTFSGTPTWSGAHTFSGPNPGISVTNNAAFSGLVNVASTISLGTAVAALGTATLSTPNGSHININTQSAAAHVKIGNGLLPLDFGPSLQTTPIAATNVGPGTGTGFLQSANVSGGKNLGSIQGFNQWNVSSDVAAMTGQPMAHTALNYNFGGGAYTGNRIGMFINVVQTGAAAGTSGAGGIVALQAGSAVTNTFGGTNLGPGAAGAIFGANIVTKMSSGAVNLLGTVGMEIDAEADTGSTYQSLTGLSMVVTSAHRVAGVMNNNVGIGVTGQTNSLGWDTAFQFGGWSLTSGGTVLRAEFAADRPTFNIGKGFDLRAPTFAGDIFAASGFAVGPTGRVRVGTGYFDVTATGAALSADGVICTAGTLTASVATTYPSDGNYYYADDPYGGMWLMTFVTGTSSITGVAQVAAGVVKGAPPANPVTLTPRGRLNIFQPGTITANLTWDTTRTALVVQSLSSGKLGFFNATPVVKPTVTGAWAGNTAGKALSTALAAYGLIVDSTTA